MHTQQHRTQRGVARVCGGAALAAVAVLVVACSSSTAGPQVASLGGHHGGTAGPPGMTTAQSDQDMLSFTRCMRAHDIAMLDPTSFGALNLGRVPGISSDFGRYSPQFRAADVGCRHLLPADVHDDGTGP